MKGAALCAATFGLLVTGLQLSTHDMGIAAPVATLLAGGIIAWVFVRHEKGVEGPVLPMELLAQPRLAQALASNFSAVMGSMIVLVYVPFMLQEQLGYTPAAVGGMMASYALASVMIAPVSGYLSDFVPVKLLCTSGMVVATIGLVLLALMPEHAGKGEIAWRLWVCGAGFGLYFSPNARLIIGSAPSALAASAGSMVTTARMLGQAIGATATAALLAFGLGGTPAPLLCSAVLVAAAGLGSALLKPALRP